MTKKLAEELFYELRRLTREEYRLGKQTPGVSVRGPDNKWYELTEEQINAIIGR